MRTMARNPSERPEMSDSADSWQSPRRLPELAPGEYGWPMSAPVLGFCRGGKRQVVRLEHIDEDSPPRWYTDCSEHWCVDGEVIAWRLLPPEPTAAELAALSQA